MQASSAGGNDKSSLKPVGTYRQQTAIANKLRKELKDAASRKRRLGETAEIAAESMRLDKELKKEAANKKRREEYLAKAQMEADLLLKTRRENEVKAARLAAKAKGKAGVVQLVANEQERLLKKEKSDLKKLLDATAKKLKESEEKKEDYRTKLEQVALHPNSTVSQYRSTFKVTMGPTVSSEPVLNKLPKISKAVAGMTSQF